MSAARIRIDREVSRVAYAKNGNTHNPTKTYRWVAFVDDRRVGTCAKLRDAKDLANEVVADLNRAAARR